MIQWIVLFNIEKSNKFLFNFMTTSLSQDFHQNDILIPENKIEQKFDIYNSKTRPGSNMTLCDEPKKEDIFAKPDDLESIDGGSKDINQNIFINEKDDINMPFQYNYCLFGNQENYLKGNKMNSFQFDEINMSKDNFSI